MCQNYRSDSNGGAQEKCDNYSGIVGMGIPSIIFWYHDTLVNSFGGGVGIVWFSPHIMDIPY